MKNSSFQIKYIQPYNSKMILWENLESPSFDLADSWQVSVDGHGRWTRRARKRKSMIKERRKGEKKHKYIGWRGEEVDGGMEERNLHYGHRGTVEGVPPTVWKQAAKSQRGRSGIPLTQTSTPTHSGNGFITELPPPDFTHPWSQTLWGHQEALMCIITT